MVGYDLRSQVDLIRGALAYFRDMRTASSEGRTESDEGTERVRLEDAAWPWVFASAAALALASALAFVRLRRRAQGVEPDSVQLARALERAMTRLGHPRAPGETPTAWAEALRAKSAPHADLVSEVTAAYAEARYRSRAIDPDVARALRAKIRRLPRRVRPQATPPDVR